MKSKKPSYPNAQNTPNVREIIETVIRNHPQDCIFAPGAVDRVVIGAWKLGPKATEAELLDYLSGAIGKEEIYCPHEGIDRRAEFGINT